jgi:hypothetical protein
VAELILLEAFLVPIAVPDKDGILDREVGVDDPENDRDGRRLIEGGSTAGCRYMFLRSFGCFSASSSSSATWPVTGIPIACNHSPLVSISSTGITLSE